MRPATEAESAAIRGKGNPNHDYAAMFDGRVWALEQGTDFHVQPLNAAASIRAAAKRRGVPVTVNTRDGIVFVRAQVK